MPFPFSYEVTCSHMNESEDPADVAQQLLLFHATDLVHHLVAKWKNYNENNTSFSNRVFTRL